MSISEQVEVSKPARLLYGAHIALLERADLELKKQGDPGRPVDTEEAKTIAQRFDQIMLDKDMTPAEKIDAVHDLQTDALFPIEQDCFMARIAALSREGRRHQPTADGENGTGFSTSRIRAATQEALGSKSYKEVYGWLQANYFTIQKTP